MTKEQEKAIEMLENIENNPWTTKYIMSSDSKKAETVLNMIKEKDKEIEKKDKIIEQINKDIEANIYLAESNYNIEELNDYARGVYDTYINMRKQYFERKVRDER